MAQPSDDAELVRRIAQRDQKAFEALMRVHNGRLFRVARAILKDDTEAEDALQERVRYAELWQRRTVALVSLPSVATSADAAYAKSCHGARLSSTPTLQSAS